MTARSATLVANIRAAILAGARATLLTVSFGTSAGCGERQPEACGDIPMDASGTGATGGVGDSGATGGSAGNVGEAALVDLGQDVNGGAGDGPTD